MSDSDIDYQKVLADLEEKKAKIEAAIEGIKVMLGHSVTGPILNGGGSARADSIPSDAFFGMSIVDAAKKYLRMVKSKRTTADIVAALERGGITHSSKNFTNTVYAGLFRDEKQGGDIVRVGKDWGLAEWYPGKRRIKVKTIEEIEEEEKMKDKEETGD
jgi:hypothetical protein